MLKHLTVFQQFPLERVAYVKMASSDLRRPPYVQREYLKKVYGFTLIEIVIVLALLGLLVGMFTPILTQGLNSFLAGENIVNANGQGQLAIERMGRDISLIRSSSDLSAINPSDISFTDMMNNSISYSLSGTNLMLTQNGNSVPLAQGIQNLSFSYFDKNGTVTASASAVRLIKISFNLILNNVNYSLATMIYPRNLQ